VCNGVPQAWQQHHLLQAACEGYCMPITKWLRHVEKLSENLLEDVTMIALDLCFTQGKDSVPSLDVSYRMDGVRMFVTVQTLKSIVDTTAQSSALERYHSKSKASKASQHKTSEAPKSEKASTSSNDASSTIKALTGIRVKVRMHASHLSPRDT
jgi:hypothetical protein